MATAADYTAERLNYYRICYVANDILPEVLRTIFKQEWDSRYKATKGEWKDEPRNGTDFYNKETPKNKNRFSRLLRTMRNGNTAEWDCTMLFYAILYSDCISHRKAEVESNVNVLRTFRNETFAHMPQGQVSDLDFQSAMSKVLVAFQALDLPTVKIQHIKNQKSFPTDELRDVLTKVKELEKDLQERREENEDFKKQRKDLEDQPRNSERQRQGLEDKLKETGEQQEKEKQLKELEVQRQVLEDQLRSDTPPFCILPPEPSHDVADRYAEVTSIIQQLKELKQANKSNLTHLYISGNPGSGKSQLARLVAKRFYKDIQEDSSSPVFVMTLNAETLDKLLESYISFARQMKCPEYAVLNIHASKDLKMEKINSLISLISTKIGHYVSWLLVADNVNSLSQMHAHLPQLGHEQWARGQLVITTQDTTSIPSNSSSIQHMSVNVGMGSKEATSLLAMISGISNSEMGEKVAERLDYQPLSLASAATYVKQIRQSTTGFGWNDFLKKLEKGKRSTTETRLKETNPCYKKSLTAATTLAVEEVMKSDKVIDHTFRLLSLCAPQPLPVDIVVNYINNVDEEIEDREMIIMKLQRCSLLLLNEEETNVYICTHQLVHDVIKSVINDSPEKAVDGAMSAFDQFIKDNLPEKREERKDSVIHSYYIVKHLQTFAHSFRTYHVSST